MIDKASSSFSFVTARLFESKLWQCSPRSHELVKETFGSPCCRLIESIVRGVNEQNDFMTRIGRIENNLQNLGWLCVEHIYEWCFGRGEGVSGRVCFFCEYFISAQKTYSTSIFPIRVPITTVINRVNTYVQG